MDRHEGPASNTLRVAPEEILRAVRRKGVRIWAKDGQLHYRAPKGLLTAEEKERLRECRDRIVTLLETSGATNDFIAARDQRTGLSRAPMTFSQLAHWQAYHLHEQPSIRQVAYALRLRGKLNIEALRKSMREIVRRHDALRTRIVTPDGEPPIQEINEVFDLEIEFRDLASLEDGIDKEMRRQIREFILQPVDISRDPLFGIRLLKLRENEHVLVVALEHLISDGFSLNLLLRELFAAYVQAVRSRSFSLPEIPVSFAEYAMRQRAAHEQWVMKNSGYWQQRLAGCRRVRFPEDRDAATGEPYGWGTQYIRLDATLKEKVGEWSRSRRTTVVMSVFVAYVALVLRWCHVDDAVVQYQVDGRVNAKLANTIGYFASALCLRVQLRLNDTFSSLVERVTQEYCNAYAHADFSYLAAQIPRPDYTRNALFNWLPQGALKIDVSDLESTDHALSCSMEDFVHPMAESLTLDMEPVVLFSETDTSEIVGELWYPCGRVSSGSMVTFARNIGSFVRAMLTQPEVRIGDIQLL